MNTQNDNEPAIDSITYILDTSSVRGLRADDVRFASSRFDVAVSPITVFEFLCHIDERGKKERCLLLPALIDMAEELEDRYR